ncbi:MAG TPA: hypothetical protein VLC08_11075 [Chitinolyticbacter sp.]|nr:hypothetical protein [Chitinolyticbacter sp.]
MNTVVSHSAAVSGNHDDAEYAAFMARIDKRFQSNTANGTSPLFMTDRGDLWTAYINAFPVEQRQRHSCHCCRQFIERFGGLVCIDGEGQQQSALWHEDDAPEGYRPAIAAMIERLQGARITGVFLSEEKGWGKPETGIWRHLAVRPAATMVFKRANQTVFQARAEKAEDFKTVMTVLNEFTEPHLELALTLLQSDALYRSEKVLGPARWLHALHQARTAARGSAKANVVWRAIATAPAGFCHPRSSMIGSLLQDIAAGMDFDEVSRRFHAKMHPLQYQRPQAAPTAGAIAAAEKLVHQLGAAGALARRFARLEEIQALWQPVLPKESQTAGVFGRLKAKVAGPSAASIKIPAQTMTWEKFQRTVMPTAESIEFFVPKGKESFTSLVTAVNPDAPPILQWDHEQRRNPMSWYFWHGGSTAEQFGLKGGSYHKVAAVTLKPSMWNGGYEHQGQGVVFVIDGARDTQNPGLCLFPEILKSEFHGVRSVIEAYSKDMRIQGGEEASAAGVMLQKGSDWNALVRVVTDGKALEYKLDRWD